jgi:hypothetical protein
VLLVVALFFFVSAFIAGRKSRVSRAPQPESKDDPRPGA